MKGGDTEIDLLFEKEECLLRIYENWINFRRIHEVVSYEVFRLARGRPLKTEAFFYDYIIEDLFELALDDIRGALELDLAECAILRRVACECIR